MKLAIKDRSLPPSGPKDTERSLHTRAHCGPWHWVLALVVTEYSAERLLHTQKHLQLHGQAPIPRKSSQHAIWDGRRFPTTLLFTLTLFRQQARHTGTSGDEWGSKWGFSDLIRSTSVDIMSDERAEVRKVRGQGPSWSLWSHSSKNPQVAAKVYCAPCLLITLWVLPP